MIGADLLNYARTRMPESIWRRHVDAWISTLLWKASEIFGSSYTLALHGSEARDAVQLRQLAIYVGHTVLAVDQVDCAAVLGLSRQSAQRAMQAIEKLREDPAFNARLERLEAIAQTFRETSLQVRNPQPRACMPKPAPLRDAASRAEGVR